MLLGRKVFDIELFYFYLERVDFQRFFFIEQLKGWSEVLLKGEFYDKYLKNKYLVFLFDIDLENSVLFVLLLVLFLEMESDWEIV